MADVESTAIAFVTKKVLVTFTHPVCIMIDQSAVYTNAAVCEYKEETSRGTRREETPRQLTIVGLPDGRPLSRSYVLHLPGYSMLGAMIELD